MTSRHTSGNLAPLDAEPMTISAQVARRYLLGRQGLWPGRRWSVKEGAVEAVRDLESVQMDPMTVVARSHDLVLWSRVEGYEPRFLQELLYVDRRFFDYGGHLDIYPIDELPYWRFHMRRREGDARVRAFAETHPGLLDEVLHAIKKGGPIGTRDLSGSSPVKSYRGSKDTSLALYNLWLTGELMTSERRGFERIYDPRERVAPPRLGDAATETETEQFFAAKALRKNGLGTARAWAGYVAYAVHRPVTKAETRRWLENLLNANEALGVLVEDQKEPYYLPAVDAPLLHERVAGRVPAAWRSLGSTTDEEVNPRSPMDNLLGRERTLALFGFEYVWEVYKPAARRRWGRYTMPVLWGDRLVARLEPRLDRKTGALAIDGFWFEERKTAVDPAFGEAVARALTRFARFHSRAQHKSRRGWSEAVSRPVAGEHQPLIRANPGVRVSTNPSGDAWGSSSLCTIDSHWQRHGYRRATRLLRREEGTLHSSQDMVSQYPFDKRCGKHSCGAALGMRWPKGATTAR